jgi:hypothetical protein
MAPLLSAAASYGAGKLASWLTPSKSGQARKATESAATTLDGYRGGWDGLTRQGQATLEGYSPQLDEAVADYSNYLKTDYGNSDLDQAELAAQTEGINQDAQRAAARIARQTPTDSVGSGALIGAQTSIEDRRLAGVAGARAKIASDNILRQEQRKRAQIELLAQQIARGQGQLGAGLSGGQGIAAQLLQLRGGQEANALNQDAATLQGWQELARQIAMGAGAGGGTGA